MTIQISAQEFAAQCGGELIGNGNVMLNGVSSLQEASETQLSFLANEKYADQVSTSNAGVILIPADFKAEPKENQALIKCDNSNIAFNTAIDLFAPPAIEFPAGIHPTAYIADTATIGSNVHIGPNAIVEEQAVIGDNSVVVGGAYIGHESKLGNNCLIYANATIRERSIIGNRVIIHPGAVIGSDGFGFAPGPQGIVKIAQVGIVQIDDDVEIGANTAIDRARFGKTWIKQGTKLDNLVQIGHNVEIGMFTMICGQAGVAGSTTIGNGVIMAGRSASNGHITVADGATIAGNSAAITDVAPGEVLVGFPAESKRNFASRVGLPKKVKKLTQQIKELQKQIEELSK